MASVSVTRVDALKRWYVPVQSMRCIVELGERVSAMLDASTMGMVSVLLMRPASGKEG